MSPIRITVLVLFISATACLNGQQLVNPDKVKEEIFTARVKQFAEFVDRFNLATDFKGNPADSSFLKKMPREKMLKSLFDAHDPREINQNASFSATKDAFVKQVADEKRFLNKHSSGIIAEAKSVITINGRQKTIRIFLSQEVSAGGSSKWVMLSVSGFTDDVFLPDTSMVRFISPSSNETAFINLSRALGDKDHLQAYASRDFKPDELSIFLYAVNQGIAKFEYAEEVIYHIVSIPGWYFEVKDFNRNELNSGWLISDLKRGNFSLKNFSN